VFTRYGVQSLGATDPGATYTSTESVVFVFKLHETAAVSLVSVPTVTPVGAVHALSVTVDHPDHALGKMPGTSDRTRT
jgi:hypothetical protein